MTMGQNTQFSLFVVLLSLSQGCETSHAGILRFNDDGLQEAVAHWRSTAPPEDVAALEKLEKEGRAIVHFSRTELPEKESRGGASTRADQPFAKAHCIFHPSAEGIPTHRNWDVFYDESLRAKQEKKLKLPTPTDAILQHEIMGHVVPGVRDPRKAEKQSENDAIRKENEYRKKAGLPLVPWAH